MTFQPTSSLTINQARSQLAAGLQAIAQGQKVIDLSTVNAADSAAVAVLIAWKRAARRAATDLSFSNVPATLSNLAALYGVAELLGLQQPPTLSGSS